MFQCLNLKIITRLEDYMQVPMQSDYNPLRVIFSQSIFVRSDSWPSSLRVNLLRSHRIGIQNNGHSMHIISVTLELNVRTNLCGKWCSIHTGTQWYMVDTLHWWYTRVVHTGDTPEWYTLVLHQSGSQVERQVCSCVDAAMETGDRCTHFNSQLENNLIKWK